MLGWEIAPHSKCGNYKLVTTEKVDDDINLIIMQYADKTLSLRLSEIDSSNKALYEYIKDILPNILSGAYDINLLKEYKDDLD